MTVTCSAFSRDGDNDKGAADVVNGSAGSDSEPGDRDDDAPELDVSSGVNSTLTPARSICLTPEGDSDGDGDPSHETSVVEKVMACDLGRTGTSTGEGAAVGTFSRALRMVRASLCGPDG